MAFLKFARAAIVDPHITKKNWDRIRTASSAKAEVPENLIERASEIFGKPFNPEEYLLTHATIVCSVDTYEPPNTKLGSLVEDGVKVNRKYGNYRVTAETQKYINNNFDAWDREVLLKSFKTFISGHNFVEHVQVEDLSKGRLIDAVARDLGDTVYVDLLIATDLKHKDLVEAIDSGKMSTLSMGCSVDGTRCTKCGHWAADDTEMCEHIRYQKGNTFFDSQGRQHRVAELCGHASIEPTGGVHFVEASWVGTPAFTGAVLRNIVTAVDGDAASNRLKHIPKEWKGTRLQKAASEVLSGWGDEGSEDSSAPATPPETKAPFDDLEQELTDYLKDRVRKRLKEDMGKSDSKTEPVPESSSTNESFVKQAGVSLDLKALVGSEERPLYARTLDFLCKTASCEADLINKVALLNAEYGVEVPVPLYRASLRLGSLRGYTSAQQYITACHAVLGKAPTISEVKTLIRLGTVISRRSQDSRENKNSLAVAKVKEKRS